jgi:mRNA interferase MazF
MGMNRGDLVTVSTKGDYGKPRPALVIQSDLFEEHPSVIVLLVTSELRDAPLFRITIEPDGMNKLNKTSQIMIDKIFTVNRDKVGAPFGKIDDSLMISVNRALALFLGFA